MGNFKIEIRYQQFCYDFMGFIRCMKAAFYRPDYKKLSVYQKTCPSINSKTCGRIIETLSRAFESLGQAFEGLREN